MLPSRCSSGPVHKQHRGGYRDLHGRALPRLRLRVVGGLDLGHQANVPQVVRSDGRHRNGRDGYGHSDH